MAFDFPNAPTNGQQVNGPGGVVFTWDGTKWTTGTGGGNVAFAPLNNPILVGDPRAPTAAMGDADTSIATTAFVTPAYANVGRNLLHNGLFRIWQRGAGPFNTVGYTTDRWLVGFGSGDIVSTTGGTASDANRATIGDEAARNLLSCNITGGSGATNYIQAVQRIEGVSRLAGKTVTVSFYANSSVANFRVGVSFDIFFGTGGSPSATINGNGQAVTLSATATTFTRQSVTLTLPSMAGMTLGTNNDDCMILDLWLSAGSSFAARSGNIGVQTGFVNFWGVQCEIGAVATPLEKLDPQTDLANCQRFYFAGVYSLSAYGNGGWGYGYYVALPVPMRAAPTCTVNVASSGNVTGATANAAGGIAVQVAATVTATGGAYFQGNFTASADL